ncbi:MAG: tetratricopeptide repeat protein, partial [Planctomycetota bacterium]|nr:tetratricopeptide repeat protein [Planctomycetota bacterium]
MAGAGAIVLLASIGVPRHRQAETIDRHTGERIIVVRTVADALYAARREGNARDAREMIAAERDRFEEVEILDRFEAILAAELSAPLGAESPAAHPAASVVRAERDRAANRRDELKRLLGRQLDRATLLALLSDLEADTAVAEATEGFFEPLGRWRQERPDAPDRPDAWAARRLRALDTAEDDDPPTEKDFLQIVDAFRSQNRLRARRRWLLRAFGAVPGSAKVRDRLVQTYLEHNRLEESFLIIGTALRDAPDNMELWNFRAQIAGWLSRPALELDAREKLLAALDTVEARERIVTLCEFVGQPERAIPHAVHLAKGSTDPVVLERPARLALAGGKIDRALELLAERAEETGDHKYWRGKIIEYAHQDLRVARVIAELELLHEKYPDGDYGARLESVYRRRNMIDRLAPLLDKRLEKNPEPRLEREVIGMYSLLGNEERIRAILVRRAGRTKDALVFFEDLPTYVAAGLPEILEHGARIAQSDEFRPKHVSPAIEALRPFFTNAEYRGLAVRIARRYPTVQASRDFLIANVDASATDTARALAAEALARDHPDDEVYLRVWIDRAAWAGDNESQARARERWVEHDPDDLENKKALGDLYVALDRSDEALAIWKEIAESDGVGSEASLFLIEALFAADRIEEAVALLEQRAALPGASIDDRLDVAERLFGSTHFDRSMRFYVAVLDADPAHPLALLRLGQIRSWTNDPRGAIPFFEARLAATDELAAEVRYYLGEAHWSVRQEAEGRRYHERALAELGTLKARTLEQDIMVAKMLARFGRVDEAIPLFDSVIERRPDDFNLTLDYADSMLATNRLEKARELVERAKTLEPGGARVMRLDGSLLIREEKPEEAAEVLAQSLAKHGPEAGSESERGLANERLGRWEAAADAYRRSLQLQPGNVDISRSLQALADRLADLVHAEFTYRRSGDDRVFGLRAAGSIRFAEKTRGAAEIGWHSYEGAATSGQLSDSVATFGVALFHRLKHRDTIAGGLFFYPGAEGDLPVGGWVGVYLQRDDPYRTFEAVAFGNLLWNDPAAAVALGGRRSGLDVRYQRDVGKRYWIGGALRIEALSLDTASVDDTRVDGVLTFGWRIHEGVE